MKAALLPDRGVVKVSGAPARDFLNGLLTSDMAQVAPKRAAYAALLTPQGKIIVDAIVIEAGDGLYLEVPRALAPELVSKLNFYKLRAKVQVEDLSDRLGIMAIWDGSPPAADEAAYEDPRLAALGHRLILPPEEAQSTAARLGATMQDLSAYEAHRIAHGVPSGGCDFIYGDAFPHEADMDQLGGVDFAKGCYVGQEVVSRMEHRGTARTRIIPVATDGPTPDQGLPIMAGEKQIGTTGSSSNGRGLAMLRLDRLANAIAEGQDLIAGGIVLRPRKPAWAKFPVPGATSE